MEDTPAQRLGKAMRSYFQAEKKGGLLIAAWGLIALFSGIYLFKNIGGPLGNGAAYPVGAIALAHLIIGGTVYFRTDKQLAALMEGLKMFPKEMLVAEQQRMGQVMANFEKYKNVEMLLFFLGLAFVMGGAFLGAGKFMLGTGTGLSLQAALTLVFDLFAAYRAGFYVHELDTFERHVR